MNKKIVVLYGFLLLNLFNRVTSAQIINEGLYNGENIKYLKNYIQGGLHKDSINNPTYLSNVINFLASINAEIDSIYVNSKDETDTYVFTEIKLKNDTLDALDFILTIQNSGFFQHVTPCFLAEPTGEPFPIPNDPLFLNQWYLYQSRLSGEPNHDIDADKVWVITRGSIFNSRLHILDSGIPLISPLYIQIDHEDLINQSIVVGTNHYMIYIQTMDLGMGHTCADL